ncbi:ribosome-inactivating protein [Whalleya microplaca]|nr:ribosome-inactivating protein [Whalleya microplaca]
MSEFTEIFFVSSSADGYRAFIARLRNVARDLNTQSHQLPVLIPQQNPPTRFFDVVLRTERLSARLRIRRDNLYLEGFRDEVGEQWFEFDNRGSQRLIAGSIFLGFTGSYTSLQNVAGQRREEITLGQDQLNTAVNNLVGSTDRKVRARALIVIIQMICESMRFTVISNAIFNNYSEFLPTPLILALENGWGALCFAILHHDNDPTTFRLTRPNAMGIDTLAQAVVAVAILVRVNAIGGFGLQLGVDMEAPVGRALILNGRPLVEIFSVRILHIDGEDPGQLYGTIRATDGLQSYLIYDRDRENAESISTGEHATLTGPSRAISAAGDFTIDFDLKDRDFISQDDEISRGQFAWNVYDHTNILDTLRAETITGDNGSVAMNYAVMSNAAEALIEIILVEGDGEDTANVYGRIHARNFSFAGEIDLFRRSDSDHVNVKPNQRIPLLRSALAIPMDGTLSISASLFDHDVFSPDDEIAQGFAEFEPQISTSVFKVIEGKHGKIDVRVSWL